MTKVFDPSPEFAAQAHVSSEAIAQSFRDTAEAQPEAFWRELSKALKFQQPFSQVLEWNFPRAHWFVGGKINVAENCVDRHAQRNPQGIALIWEGEPDPGQQVRTLTWSQLKDLVSQIANTLLAQGINSGDRVAIYMPMVPETVASMLACARIGAVHTVVFGGFAAQALNDRIVDCDAKLVITADGTYRRGQFLSLKPVVDEALKKGNHHVASVLVYRRDPNRDCPVTPGRDLVWDESVGRASKICPPVALDSEHPLFILYTSGTTGKPKGLFHTQTGYLLWAHWTSRWLFDLRSGRDVYFCTADCGWITGHSYVTYGPLSNGVTVLLYEGAPTTPTPDRWWQLIENHNVSVLYTAPTAIRSLMKLGEDPLRAHGMESLRVLGSVGEPINPEAWLWYHEHVGKEKCPIVDTWWQTETGGAMIAPFPGATSCKPGSATRPLPGVFAKIVDPQTGKNLPHGQKGALVISQPWPSMARGIWGDPARYEQVYWNTRPELKGLYLTGDMAHQDEDGDFWIQGRMDDVLNISGHRLGTAEVESAAVSHAGVAEAAAVGIADAIKGQSLVLFVTPRNQATQEMKDGVISVAEFKNQLRQHIGQEIGAHAKPDQIRVAAQLPKTRSGKIMRRLLRELASTGKISGDITTLEDFSAEQALAGDES